MKVCDVLCALAEIAPPDLVAPWDNSGFLLGDRQAEVTKVYVCLDVVPATAQEAKENGCNLIVAHHPVIFGGLKQVTTEELSGRLLLQLMAAGINLAAAHTNFDAAKAGVNFVLAKALGLENIKEIAELTGNRENPGRIGELDQPLTGLELAAKIKQALKINVLPAAGLKPDGLYRRIAVCGGAATELWQEARAAGAEAYLSADGKHHVALEAAAAGFALFDGGHFQTESLAMPALAEALHLALPELELVLSTINTCPWRNY